MPYKLLLADDSVTIQRVIELTFADEDVELIAVGDGQEAIDRIEADRPDVVLADVGMPKRDGYEVAAFVKHTPHLSHIPVLLLTGAFDPVDEKRAKEAGCDGVLAKPFEPHMVITRVRELLAGARRGDHPPATWPVRQLPSATRDDAPSALAAPPAIPAALVGPPVDAAVRLSRRTPIAVPGFGSPAPPSPGDPSAALDEYFDRLDAAFAAMQHAPAAPSPEAEESAGAAALPSGPESLVSRAGADAADSDPAQPRMDAPASGPEVGEPARGPAASGFPLSVQSPGIAQAFSALFAAERGEAAPGPIPGLFGAAALPQASLDDLVERVTQQVLERLSDRVVRETVAEIVSRVSERLVREEIDRVKATLK